MATVVREGFQVDEDYVKSVRKPQVGGVPSALSDLRPAQFNSSLGINGLLQLCNVSSTCQVSPVNHAGGQTTPMAWGIEVAASTNLDPRTRRLVRTVSKGLRAQQDPEAALDGLGGTYFFMNEAGQKAALMKPCDEEPFAPNNPKGFVGRQLGDPGMKSSVKVGEAAIREVAAYILDHDHRARVPATVLVRASHPVFHYAELPIAERVDATKARSDEQTAANKHSYVVSKLGSLQEFLPHMCDSSEVGASRFNAKNIHRIGILDLRLLNTDRHAGNMLVRQPNVGSSAHIGLGAMLMESNQLELVPIDHGFCLPDSLEAPYFEWLHWPQAMLPFDDEELDYISDLDPEKDVAILRQHLPMLRDSCLRLLFLSTILLKRCAASGLTLAEIGEVYSRPLVGMDEEPSELEKLCLSAWQHVVSNRLESENLSLIEDDTDFDIEGDDCDETEKSYQVSDSASSHHAAAHNVKSGILAGKPGEVEDVHDSPRSDYQLVSTPGSAYDLQFELDEDTPTPLTPHKGMLYKHASLHGEADSWSLAAFSVASLSIHDKRVSHDDLVCVDGMDSPNNTSDDSHFEYAASVNPVSGLQQWRRHNASDVLLGVAVSRRRGCTRAACAKAVNYEPGNIGDLDSSEWEVFMEGFCGHLEAALQAGVWKASNRNGTVSGRNLMGTSAPC